MIKSTIQKIFGAEKQILLFYPNCIKPFLMHLYNDASNHKLGQSSYGIENQTTIDFYL
jgi:hypothetical protein